MSKVVTAFQHVKSFFPQVNIVVYNKNGMWCYMDEDFNTLNFEGVNIDVSVLQDASDSITIQPFVYQED
jgi:hypothetical protein